MKTVVICAMACAILCLFGSSATAGMADCVNDVMTKPFPAEPAEPPIRNLLRCANSMMNVTAPYWVEFARYGKSECSDALREAQSLASQCADDRIVAAVESAKGKDDLRAAVKDYYIKQKALVTAWGPSSGQTVIGYKRDLSHAEAEADAAWDKVRLEGKLAGIPLDPKNGK